MFFGKALVVCFAAFQFQSQLLVVESGPVDADVNVEQYWDLVSQVSPWSSVAVVAAEVVRQRATNREIPGLIPVGTCAFFSSLLYPIRIVSLIRSLVEVQLC